MAKVKRHETFIDMTAMSDVTVLLLTFFMLTATFKPLEPVEVNSPASVSETKVQDHNILTILIDKSGRVFLNMDRDQDKIAVLALMGSEYGVRFNEKQIRNFVEQTHVGVPMSNMPSLLDIPTIDQGEVIREMGVPLDTIATSKKNELAAWIRNFKVVNEDATIAIKADATTPYPLVDEVLKTLVGVRQNRYNLVTTLKAMPAGL